MQFSFAHNNFNVRDLDRSLSFYKEALGLTESSRINAPDGSFIIVYLTDGVTPHLLELTWLRDWDKPYNLGDNEFHLAFRVDDFDAAHAKHKEMDCICFENPAMGNGHLFYLRPGRLLAGGHSRKVNRKRLELLL